MPAHIQDLFDLSGRVAIVTGGSRGLGQEIATGLAEAGAAIMLCARREQWLNPAIEEMAAGGFQVDGLVCDVSHPQQVQQVVDATIAAFGRVDILVNNAGITWGEAPEKLSVESWRKVLDVNLTGSFLFAQAAGKQMLKAGKGSIINMASIAGMISNPFVPTPSYSASKAGLFGLTHELAAAWSRQGVRVNAIAPGFFHSRMADKVIEQIEPHIRSFNPIPRVGNEGELKGVAVFLASDASSYITGQTIVVDGGMSIV